MKNLKYALLPGALLLSATASHAAIEIDNDPALPPSSDGFNITRDTENQLEWLDLDVSIGRTPDDLLGVDGSDEFGPGGDFEGFRYATHRELTGAINGPQLPSLYRSLDINPFGFSSIGGYTEARAIISIGGCFGSCASYGYTNGNLLQNDRQTLTVASMEAFPFQGYDWGTSRTNGAPTVRPPNDALPEQRGNYLVRPVADSDSDGDLIPDLSDNCTQRANPQQIDVDGDGHGNFCDADLTNDCIVNASDLTVLRSVVFTNYPASDFNSDGVVNLFDVGVMRSLFFMAPGPSANGLCTPVN